MIGAGDFESNSFLSGSLKQWLSVNKHKDEFQTTLS